jgi:hypothetical protein
MRRIGKGALKKGNIITNQKGGYYEARYSHLFHRFGNRLECF